MVEKISTVICLIFCFRDICTVFFIKLSFGTFKIRNKNERIGRNPKTGIEAKISSRKVVTFKPSRHVKEIIKN